ncbi:MAG: DUF4968 domain-containing protein [Lactobacillales bacterium]|nr:DUF4968 domain-containing protein [Lactobacillales bacterium]
MGTAFGFSSLAYAIEGVWHAPYGDDDLYSVQPTERCPRDPKAGEDVWLHITTWPIEAGQNIWIEWSKNDQSQPNVTADYDYNSGNNTYWKVNLGSFQKGDKISYTIKASVNNQSPISSESFSFAVTDWEYAQNVNSVADNQKQVELDLTATNNNFNPKVYLSFEDKDIFRVELSPTGNEKGHEGKAIYNLAETDSELTISTEKLKVVVQKNPYRMSVYKADGTLLTSEYNDNQRLGWLTDGQTVVNQFQNNFQTPEDEAFYGFGERYDSLNQRGNDVDTYVYNEYQTQAEAKRTYLAIPFFVSSEKYGMFINSDFHSQFQLASKAGDKYSFLLDNDGEKNRMLDYYIISGENQNDIVKNYTSLSGKTTLLPKWAFGLWMSANEWDRDEDVQQALNNAKQSNIPATGFVLEQWSDEQTFYIWNGATYTPKQNGGIFSYDDFTFNGKWKDPKKMVQSVHDAGMNLILWQIPALKDEEPYVQKDYDKEYMIQQKYGAVNKDDSLYRIPQGQWFGNGILLDFTNPAAVDWWTSQRKYLLDDIGIDGFKTDGGEMLWGRDATFYNGKKSLEMRNLYPNKYISTYFDFAKTSTFSDDASENAVSFSRSGTTGAQTSGIYWSGDQRSDFASFRSSVKAGLSAAVSGVSYWTWDLAGFTGNYPSSELYKRSVQMAAFAPVMQFHSEKSDPSPSEERSPWNAASRTGDQSIIPNFQKYFYTRMNLLPYIYTAAKQTADNGKSMMRPMVMDYPDDKNTLQLDQQYMFGDDLLVAPIVNDGQREKDIYLPEGEWIDLWNGGTHLGGKTFNYYADIDTMPVFVKSGAIIPMNLTDEYQLGKNVGNKLDSYQNLTFRMYPNGESSYQFYDDVHGKKTQNITMNEDYENEKVDVTVPDIGEKVTLQLFTNEPEQVKIGNKTVTKCEDLADFNAATTGYYFDKEQNLTYVKVEGSQEEQIVHLLGTNHAAYEAEFAELNDVQGANDHPGYTGKGFIAGFDQLGSSVNFEVAAKAGNYKLVLRYSAGTEAASRNISINGQEQKVDFPKTSNWDTWSTVEVPVTLVNGQNNVSVSFGNDAHTGINFDNLLLKK